MCKVLEEVIGDSLGHAAAMFGGAVLHGAISSGVATHKTIKNKRKVKLYEKTEGLSGFSRTKAKREITKDWSGAAVGTSASIAGGMAGAAVGSVMYYFSNFMIYLIFKNILVCNVLTKMLNISIWFRWCYRVSVHLLEE